MSIGALNYAKGTSKKVRNTANEYIVNLTHHLKHKWDYVSSM